MQAKKRPTGERQVYEASIWQETSWQTKAVQYFKNLKRKTSQLLPSFPTRFPRYSGIPEFRGF